MKVSGSRKRYIRDGDGVRTTLIIRRLYCEECQKLHHELPDLIVPYRRYDSEAIEEIVSNEETAVEVSCENSTIRRIKNWFSLFRKYIESCLQAIITICARDAELTRQLSQFLPLEAKRQSAGWLKYLVRIVVNSGRWPQTRSAFMSI